MANLIIAHAHVEYRPIAKIIYLQDFFINDRMSAKHIKIPNFEKSTRHMGIKKKLNHTRNAPLHRTVIVVF